jgi:hypothetical protein
MLTSVPAQVLNAIQASGRMQNPQLSKIFSMSDLELAETHDQLTGDLMKKGMDRSTALAYLDVMPLMVERKAISGYLSDSNREDLRQALPNLETPDEAATVGTKNRNLNPQQSASLLRALEHVYR